MKTKSKVPNNQDAIAKSIQRFGQDFGITAVGDDGNVCVNAPNREAQIRIGILAADHFGHTVIGDGCQRGSIFINCDGQDSLEIGGTILTDGNGNRLTLPV